MKKKMMPLAVSAAIAAASSAQAQMFINNEGTGEILVFPYYSAENGNTTNVNIANTTGNAKAVKVRIIEGENSQEVLDFNVYMSPKDHFSFAISATADGGGQLTTGDNTCTVPKLTVGEPVAFRNFKYAGDKGKDNPATEDKDESFDNTGLARTAVGYIEVIEMGQISDAVVDLNDPATPNDAKDDTSMLKAITHGADGVPANCDLPVIAWSSGGPWYTEVTGTANTPATKTASLFFESNWVGGGLYGEATVINVNDALAFGTDAVAIDSAVAGTGSQLHYPPGDTQPDFTSDGIVADATVASNGPYYDLTWVTPVADTALLAVSSVFQTSVVMNDYVTDPGIAGLTDWILTMPTKSLHIARWTAEVKDASGAVTTAAVAALDPFTNPWNGQTACEYATLDSWDREEANPPPALGSTPDFSPAPPTPDVELYDLPLCYEVNVVQFGATSAVKNESLAVGINAELVGTDGWASIDLRYDALSADGKKTVATHQRKMGGNIYGLPVTGFAVQTYANNSVNASGNVANYAGAYLHKTSTQTSGLTAR